MTGLSVTLPHRLPKRVHLPASKSLSARALVVRALCGMPCDILRLAECDDTAAVVRALATTATGDAPQVTPPTVSAGSTTGQPAAAQTIDIGAAGTAMRFLTAYYAATPGAEVVMTGTPRMLQRPIGILVEALRTLGADIDYRGEEGFPPLAIHGRQLRGGELTIDAGVSSQYISALLMLGPTLTDGLTLHLAGEIASRPYILMTLRLMAQWGARTAWQDAATIRVAPGGYMAPGRMVIEPDWSGASYWYALVALNPDDAARVLLEDLRADSLQGDSVCAAYFANLGVHTEFTSEGAILTKSDTATTAPLHLDFSDCPDLAQTFVVTAALQGRAFRFEGLKSLHIKETDRIAALIAELAKLGLVATETAPGVLESPGQAADSVPAMAGPPPHIATYDDHRMAMAFAPAAYRYPGLVIEHPEVVSKSYPTFFTDLLGPR